MAFTPQVGAPLGSPRATGLRRRTSLSMILLASCTILTTGCASEMPLPEPRDRLNGALLEAVRANRVSDVKDLLGRGADPNALVVWTDGGDTPLVIAARDGYVDAARVLLAAGANVDGRDSGTFEGRTPLGLAAASNRAEIVDLFLQHGANVNSRSGLRGAGATALHWAARYGHLTCVVRLLAYGAAVERRDLEAAISGGHVEIVSRLLEAGADPWWRFSETLSVLEHAERSPKPVRAEMIAIVKMFRRTP